MRELVSASYGEVLRAAALFAPHSPKLARRRSRLLRRRGDVAGALALIERVLVAAPGDSRLLVEYTKTVIRAAGARSRVGDAAGALALIERALVAAPENPQLLAEYTETVVHAAGARLKVGDAAGALSLADKAIAKAGNHAKLIAVRAAALCGLARYQDGLGAWRQFSDQLPHDTRGWIGKARALYVMGRQSEIKALIDEYLATMGNRPERFLRAAQVALRYSHWTEVAALLSRAEAAAGGDHASLREIAEFYVKVGHVGRALELFNEACRLDPEDAVSKKHRDDTLRTLRAVGIDVATISEGQRSELRMPDLALLRLIERGRAPNGTRFGHLAVICSSLGPGGAQRQVLNTIHGLHTCEAVHRTTVIPLLDDRPLHQFHAAKIASLPITIQPSAAGSMDMDHLTTELGSETRDLLRLIPSALRAEVHVLVTRFLRDTPEVVHAWGDRTNVAAGIAAAMTGVPRLILSGRGVAPNSSRLMPSYYHAVYTALLDRPGTVLVNNSAFGANTYAEWLGVDRDRIRVIYNGVDVDGLEGARDLQATASHRKRLGVPKNAKVVGSLFRLNREKRPLLWLEAAAEVVRRYPAAHFVLLGEGRMRGDMAEAANRLGIAERVHMPGAVQDVTPWYDLMDLVLLTSMYEGTSNTALEGQALGVPVVSTAVGGMSETVVPDVSGFLVDADSSPAAIADRVLLALTDDEWRRRACATAKAFIRERFSLERMVRDTLEVYGLHKSNRA